MRPRRPRRLVALSWILCTWACTDGAPASDDGTDAGDEAPSTGADDDATSTGGAGPGGDDATSDSTAAPDPTADTTAGPGDGETGDVPPPPVLGACDDLGAEGVFEEITPPEVAAALAAGEDGGPFAFAVDPVHQGTIYSGTLFQRLWKSEDCGATWTAIATGTNGEAIDSGMNWTLAVDPIEPQVVYTNSGYGANGLFKSSNGGVDWEVVWPPRAQPELGAAFTYNFANVIALDPDDHEHVLLTFHESCLAPHPETCIAESHDAGASWVLHDGEPEWNGNEGQVIFFLDDSSTWLWGSQTNGFWRSGDAGGSWAPIVGMTTSHLQGSQLWRSDSGRYFVAGADAIWTSADGLADAWSAIPDTGPILGGLIGDEHGSIYASTCYFGDFCDAARYLRSDDDGATWNEMPSPGLSMGGNFGYDPGHGVLYSSNLDAGLWRVVVDPTG